MDHTRDFLNRTSQIVPPHLWFGVSAVFHYLGPAFAVLLFPAVGVLGVAWLRIASAALFFAPLTRPARAMRRMKRRERGLLVAFGTCLAAMNCSFYLALDRLPLSLVAAIEFTGAVSLALYGARTRRNVAALALVVAGVAVLINVEWAGDPAGLFWAFLNSVFFVGYITLGHRMAESGAGSGVERLGAGMLVAFIVVSPVGVSEATSAFADPRLIIAGAGIGLCSSVIPYVCDQLAMARLPRASFALLLALLPASAAIVGAVVLTQIPALRDLMGIFLVMAGIVVHQPAGITRKTPRKLDD